MIRKILRENFRNGVFAAAVLLVGLGAFNRVAAQGSTGSILGAVADASGASVPDAAVEAKNVATGVKQTTTSDSQGRFRIPGLIVGEYEVQASKTGFSTVVRPGITLAVGSESVVDFALPVGQQQQTVTVEGEVSQVETTNATVGALVDQKQMRELPLNGRNFEQLMLLAPGVQTYSALSASGAQGRSNSFSVSGSRSEGQALLLDGENLQTFWNRGLASISGTSLGVEAIAEFQTLTNTYSAQFGGNGAVMNSVSKSGTNALHGSAYDFLRNSALDARNFFDPGSDPPPFRKNQFGGSVGGPIQKNKAFFFGNYEGIRQLLGETKIAFVPACNLAPTACTITSTNPATATAIAQGLALYPQATTLIGNGIGTSTQIASQTANENYFLGRIDYTLTEKDSVFVRYVSDKTSFFEPFSGATGTLGAALPAWSANDESHNQFSTVEWRRVISPTLVNIARVSFSRPTASEPPSPLHPAVQFFPTGSGRVDGVVDITGLTSLGAGTFNPFVINQNKYSEGDDLYWTHGSHSVKMGISITRFQSNTTLALRGGTQWTFQSLNNFLAGNALRVIGTPVTPDSYTYRDFREIDIHPYINDDWKVTPKLTLNLGLRWEFQTNPVETHNNIHLITDYAHATDFTSVEHPSKLNPSKGNLDPRIGFAYDPFRDHKTSIRGGFGLFHDAISPSIYWAALTITPPWVIISESNPKYPTPFTALGRQTPTVAPGWDYYAQNTPYMIQYNLNVQREMSSGTVLSVGYVGARGVHLFNGLDQNPVIPTVDASGVRRFATLSSTGAIVGNARLNPNFSVVSNNIPAGYSNYNSLQASLNRRLTGNLQAQVAYTYSNCMDNGGNALGALNNNTASNQEDPFNRAIDYGRCPQDVRHAFRFNGVYLLPFHGNRLVEGWQLSGILSATTGLPYNISTGFDVIGYQTGGVPRPNYTSGCDPFGGALTNVLVLNTSCFSVQSPGTVGNVGRNTGKGPNLQNTDIGLSKETKIAESVRVQFRAELFNLFNHASFKLPGTAGVFTAGAAGACTISGAGCGNFNPSAGRIVATATNSRQMQFGLKIIF